MIFSLDVRRARKGDCLLLHYGSKNDRGLIMIDGGPHQVYGPHLKPRLEEIIKKRKPQQGPPLDVDLLMVSHVDDDHVVGIIEFTDELLDAMQRRAAQFVRVRSLWHNSFDEVIDHVPDELTASFASQFGTASLPGDGELPENERSEVESQFNKSGSRGNAELVDSTLMVLASIEKGHQLRVNAEALNTNGRGFDLNPEFGGKLIIARPDQDPIDMGRGLTMTVAGPMKKEVEALRKKHNAWLKKLKKEGKAPPKALAAYVDPSVPNLSSLVLLAKAKNKTMLLTGDARGDKILKGLELIEELKPRGKMHVDIMKVPHHGSSNNLDDDFFERITADHYVFSGNGEHGNPERESLEMLLNARGKSSNYKIHLTYPLKDIDAERKKDWEKQQATEKKKKKKNSKQKVRANWSPAKHSLRAFFDASPGLEDKVEIVPATKPHLIDLLDPLGF